MWNAISISALAAASIACVSAQPLQRFERAELHMGSITRITIYARDDSAMTQAFARVRELDEKLSDYKPESELNRVCRTAHERPVTVSEDLFHVLEAAQQIARETDGAFDVTIGPATHLWRERKRPDADAMSRVGYRNLVLDPGERTVYLKLDRMQLDLGGIAKGFAADEALAVLRAQGVASALVAVSGDLAIGDPPPGKPGWSVKLESSGEVITLRNTAVSTSGSAEQSAHILDPKTGEGIHRRFVVSVIAERGLLADPLATAIYVMGAERGVAYAERRGARAIVSY